MPAVLAKLALPFGGVGLIVAAILGYYAYKQGWLNNLGLGGKPADADQTASQKGSGGTPAPLPGPVVAAQPSGFNSVLNPSPTPGPTSVAALQVGPTPQTAPVSAPATPGAPVAPAVAQTTPPPSAPAFLASPAAQAPPQAVVTAPTPQAAYQPYEGPGAQPSLTAVNSPLEGVPSSPGAPGGIQQAIAPFADTGPIQPTLMSNPSYIAPPEAVVTSGGIGAAAAQAAETPSAGGPGAFTQ